MTMKRILLTMFEDADAIIKCFATGASTAILLYLSPILFGTSFSFLVIPGTIAIFVASWLYLKGAPPKSTDPLPPDTQLKVSRLQALGHLFPRTLLLSGTLITLAICAHLASLRRTSSQNTIIESPFKNTLAYVRWNSAHAERVPHILQYEPFFHDVHISMPDYNPSNGKSFDSAGQDSTFTMYSHVADKMKEILDAPSASSMANIEGMLYFHFDAWIVPFEYANEEFDRIWFPDAPNPKFICVHDASEYPGWWGHMNHGQALKALKVIEKLDLDYVVDSEQWCSGWSDIYYVPKQYFSDFIFLATIFKRFDVFHEIAIPTIMTIIDKSRQVRPFISAMKTFSDCYGDCCVDVVTPADVTSHRCGHKLNYLDESVVAAHYDRLQEHTEQLRGVNTTHSHISRPTLHYDPKTGLFGTDEKPKEDLLKEADKIQAG